MFANLDLAKLTGTVSSGWLEMIVKSLPHLDVFQKNYFNPEKDLLFAMAQRYSAVQCNLKIIYITISQSMFVFPISSIFLSLEPVMINRRCLKDNTDYSKQSLVIWELVISKYSRVFLVASNDWVI